MEAQIEPNSQVAYLSTAEAAARLNVSASTVIRRIGSGLLAAKPYQGRYLIPVDAVEALLAGPPPPEPKAHVHLNERLAHLPELLTADQVGELLGMSGWSVRRLCGKGHLPHRRHGSTIRISKAELEDYLLGVAA